MDPEPKTSPGMIVFMQVVFLLMFLVFGGGMVREGLKAVRTGAYDFTYSESTSWAASGLSGGSASGSTLEYRDGAATMFGVGFTATGLMLLTWALGLALGLLGRVGLTMPDATWRVLAAVTLVTVTVACVTLFPPWRRHTMTLYFTIAAILAAVFLPMPDARRKQVLPGIVIAMIGASLIGFPAFPIFAGLFVTLIAGASLLLVSPRLFAWAQRNAPPDPS